ncbi:Hypothetical protein HVPorG_04202 [Roseomonas mucosa]|nr:Hypothetical protein HVPorG_04202 [Roseomonas mucosa]UZO95761.1 Hypothetical protein RMHFA_04202 [Roseomonas mucosa]
MSLALADAGSRRRALPSGDCRHHRRGDGVFPIESPAGPPVPQGRVAGRPRNAEPTQGGVW